MIDLHHNQISCVTGAFANMHALKELRLNNNNLKSVLPEDMQSCSNLIYLDIGFNKLENVNVRNKMYYLMHPSFYNHFRILNFLMHQIINCGTYQPYSFAEGYVL